MENGGVNYFVFNYKKNCYTSVYESLLYRLNPYQKQNEGLPLGRPLFRFRRDKYPICMGCGALGKKFFFLGGYIVPEGVSLRHANHYCREYSGMLYILDTTLIDSTTTEKEIEDKIETQKLDVKKSSPIVMTVGDKLYVLPRNLGATDGTPPSIHSYEPHTKKWEEFNIFDELIDESSFVGPGFHNDVIAHWVKGHEIIIVLHVGTYSFNVKDGKLRRAGPRHSQWELSFEHQRACSDDIIFGLLRGGDRILGYKDSPFGISLEGMLSKPSDHAFIYQFQHTFLCCNGLLMTVQDAVGNKMLVIRSGRGYGNIPFMGSVYIAFDFLFVVKCANGRLRCKASNSTLYHMDAPDQSVFYPIACLPIEQTNETQAKFSPGGQWHLFGEVSTQRKSEPKNETQAKFSPEGQWHLSGEVSTQRKSEQKNETRDKFSPGGQWHLSGEVSTQKKRDISSASGKCKFYVRRNISSSGRYTFDIQISIQTYFLMRLEANRARVQQQKKREKEKRAKYALGLGVPFEWRKW